MVRAIIIDTTTSYVKPTINMPVFLGDVKKGSFIKADIVYRDGFYTDNKFDNIDPMWLPRKYKFRNRRGAKKFFSSMASCYVRSKGQLDSHFISGIEVKPA